MAYDPKTRRISVGPGENFVLDSGEMFVRTLKDLASESRAPIQIKNDWNTLKTFLECGHHELSSSDIKKIRAALHTYYRSSASPSTKLQPTFDMYRKENPRSSSNETIPETIKNVFDRLHASDD